MYKRILILTYTDISRDPRVQRQIKWLKDENEITLVCEKPEAITGLQFIPYSQHKTGTMSGRIRMILLLIRLFRIFNWSDNHRALYQKLSGMNFDLIITHHPKLLPIALRLRDVGKCRKVILDAHEYYVDVYSDWWVWRTTMKPYYKWLAKNYIAHCDFIIAVNESMRDFYIRDHNSQADFITNSVDYEEYSVIIPDADKIKILHHGMASRSRKLELMIQIMDYLEPRFHLTLQIFTYNKDGAKYLEELKKLASKMKNNNIQFLPLVPPSEIAAFGNRFDIGLFFMPPSNLNEEYSLANKVYYYIQSRLMLAFSPLPEMKKLVERYDLGVVGPDYLPETMAGILNSLTFEKLLFYKQQSDKHAKELSSATNEIKFRGIIANL